jgi:hypothetical protein
MYLGLHDFAWLLTEKDLEGSSHSIIMILAWHFLDGMRKTTNDLFWQRIETSTS